MEKRKLVGVGNTAKVYEYDENRVIKLFYEGYPKEDVIKEFNNASKVMECSFFKPKVHTLTIVDNRNGIIYDKVEGISLLEKVMRTGDINHCGKILSEEHVKIFNNPGTGLDSFHEIIRNTIHWNTELDDCRKTKLLHILEKVPEKNILCHGDFHPGNIIIKEEKNYIIDFMNIAYGNPYLDIARTVYLVEMTPIPKEVEEKDQFLKFKKAIIAYYLNFIGVEREELRDYLILVLVRRLNEGVSLEEKKMIYTYLECYNV